MGVGPGGGLGEAGQHGLHRVGMLLHEGGVAEEVGVHVEDVGAAHQDVGLVAGLGEGEEGVPDRPGLDLVRGEGGGGVGGREVGDGDVVDGQARLLQRRDEQVVRAGALADGDVAALEVGDGLDAALGLGDDGLALSVGRKGGDIGDGRSGGLAEDGRRVSGPAEVDGARVERLDQGRAGGELDPGDPGPLALQGLLDRAFPLGDDGEVGLLVADLHFRDGFGGGRQGAEHPERESPRVERPS